ncbi:hypothetical protein OROMI_015258 [Orobanche minor]
MFGSNSTFNHYNNQIFTREVDEGFTTTVDNDLDEIELSDICNLIKSINMEDIPTFYRQLNPSHHIVEELLLNSVREKALTQGYSTKIKRSKKNKYVIIGCDRGGTYRPYHVPLDQRKRSSSSRLIDCPFEIWGKRKSNGSWKHTLY